MKKEMMQKIRGGLKTHFVDSTAMLAASNPIFAGLETMILGMSDEISINARLLATGLFYGGEGFLVSKGRDIYRKLVKVNENTKESLQQLHDTIYMGSFCLLTTPAFYYAAGSRDLKEIVGGTVLSTLFGLTSGGLIGYAIDAYRDLTGIKESPRIPNMVKDMSPKMKLGLVTVLTAASIALTAGIYAITSDKKQETPIEKQNIERIVNYNPSSK